MTVLAPAVSATFGSLRYDSHVGELVAELGVLPAVNTVDCVLPAAVPVDAAVGVPADVTLDGGDGAATILTGQVAAIRRTVDATVVSAVDAGGLLARLRPSATYEAQSVTDIARSLAGDAGASSGRLDPGTRLAFYAAHQGMSAAEHVARLASIGGLLATVNADGELDMIIRPPGPPDLALLFGREFVAYDVTESAPVHAPPVTVGHGPAGFVPAPNGLLASTDPLSGGAPDPGPDAVWLPSPVLRTPAAVTTASQEQAAATTAAATRLRAECWLLPSLRPGQLVEVQGLPERLPAGPWLVTAVTHRVDPIAGGVTRIEATQGGAALAGLLGGALGALGGLL
jgi:hypothetical protein